MSTSVFAIQAALLPMILQGQSPQQLLDAIETLIGTPVSFRPAGDMSVCIASKGHPETCQTEYLAYCSQDSGGSQRLIASIMDASADEYGNKFVISEDFTYSRYLLSDIAVGNKYLGFVTVPEISLPLDQVDRAGLSQCCKMLALSCLCDSSLFSTQSGILSELLQDAIHTKPQLALRLRNMLPFHNRSWQMLIMKEPKTDISDFLFVLTGLFPSSETALYQDYVCVLVDVTESSLTEKTLGSLSRFAKERNTLVVVSEPFDDLLQCRSQFQLLSVLPQRIKKEGPWILFARDSRLLSLFGTSGLGLDALKGFCDPRVIAILQSDKESNGHLYETLCCYIDCSRSVSEAAACMYVHSNTICYRLNRLKQFDLDINNVNDITNFLLTRNLIDYIRAFEPAFPFPPSEEGGFDS